MVVNLEPTGGDDTGLLIDKFAHAAPWTTFSLTGEFQVSGSLILRAPRVQIEGHAACIVQHAEDARTLVLQNVQHARVTGVDFWGRGTERPWANGSMSGNNVAAITLYGCSDTAIESCRCENHAGASILLDGACRGVRILRNYLAGVGPSVIAAGYNGCDAAIKGAANSIQKRAMIIALNDISWHCFGILVPGVVDGVINANTIHDIPGQHGAYLVQGGDLAVTGNTVRDCAEVGIKLQHQLPQAVEAAVNISANTLARNALIGISITSAGQGLGWPTRNVSVCDNNVCDSDIGMYFKDAEGTIASGNHLRHCARPVVRINTTGLFADNYIAVEPVPVTEE